MDDTNPFTNGMISIHMEDDLAYYILKPGVPLFKATKNSDTLDLRPGQLSFFGVYNMDTDYIKSYEEEYGIIFAFETTHPYKLLALDHPDTKRVLYSRVPENIKKILKKNYGYTTRSGQRESDLNYDLALSQYLCDQEYQGYATDTMPTDMGGTFHPEFMICNVNGLRPLGRITNDPSRIANILQEGRIEQASRLLKESRKKPPASPFASLGSPFASSGSPGASYGSPFASSGSPGAQSRFETSPIGKISTFSFEDMEEEDDNDENKENSHSRTNKELFGGLRKRKRRSYKKRKTRTNKRKRRRTRRKKSTRRRR